MCYGKLWKYFESCVSLIYKDKHHYIATDVNSQPNVDMDAELYYFYKLALQLCVWQIKILNLHQHLSGILTESF